MNKYYHLYSSPLQGSPLFRNDGDRRFFLNRLVIDLDLAKNLVEVFAYCLMDNHVHFLVGGEEGDILNLFADVKREYGRWLGRAEDAVSVHLRNFTVSLRLIKGEDDFKVVVAYILRNPLAAGMGSPFSYKWSSAFLYFNPWVSMLRDYSLKEYGITRFRREASRRDVIPSGIRVLDGIFNPASWCRYKRVEQIFGRSSDFFKILGKWGIENDEEARMSQSERNAYTDSQILVKIMEFCTLSGVEKVEELSSAEVKVLIRTLQTRWGASKKQLGRILGSSLPRF